MLADQVLYSGIACIVDLIVKEGLINLDLADVRTVLSGMGTAMMGTGEAAGEQRAIVAAEEAIVNPLLDDVTLQGRQEPAAVDHRRPRPDAVGGATRPPTACARKSIPTPTSSSAPPSTRRWATSMRVSIVASGMAPRPRSARSARRRRRRRRAQRAPAAGRATTIAGARARPSATAIGRGADDADAVAATCRRRLAASQRGPDAHARRASTRRVGRSPDAAQPCCEQPAGRPR